MEKIKNWNGKLAHIYSSKFFPETLEMEWFISYVDDGKGLPLNINIWPELENRNFSRGYSGRYNDFSVYINGSYLYGKFLPPVTERTPTVLSQLSISENREYLNYLQKQGYIEIPYYIKVTKSGIEKFGLCSNWDEVEALDSSISNKLWSFLGESFFQEYKDYLGFFLTTKKRTVKVVIQRRKK